MTDASWEALSNQAVAGAGVVYFLALLALLAELVFARRVAEPAEAAAEAADAESSVAVTVGPSGHTDADDVRREAFFGRLGLLLTGLAMLVHAFALLSRGLAADPNRVPWGNMYEFTLSGTFWIALLFLVALRRFALAWMAPVVVGVVLSLLMVGVLV
ncbi:MAG: c-type cytochrome biogenesis protein CcsB, partial [Nocardioides sp.]